MSGHGIEILLATYNGQSYLVDLLESLLSQDDRDFSLIVRDDGSQDGTAALLETYAQKHRGWIRIIGNPGLKLGPTDNFSSLMTQSKAPYVMLCDQDDVWHADKVAATRQCMVDMEKRHGSDVPLMVFSDLRVVTVDLKEIAASFAKFQNLNLLHACNYRMNLLQNCVAGCTIMANRALVELCTPIPHEAVLHDHWLALVASVFGHIAVIERPLIDYRQHTGNLIGAAGMNGIGLWKRFSRLSRNGFNKRLLSHVRQAGTLLRIYEPRLTAEQAGCLRAFTGIPERTWLMRRCILLKYGIHMTGYKRNIGLFATI